MRLPATAILTAVLATAASAPAATIIRDYPLFRTGIELTYGAVIYVPEDGSPEIDLTGFPLVDTKVNITYTPDVDEDINNLVIQMLVPVTGAEEEFLDIRGSEFTATATPGEYHYELETKAYNGEIRGGRWSLTTYSMDPDGNPLSAGGTYSDDSGISLVIETPEPASAAAIVGGLLALGRRRR